MLKVSWRKEMKNSKEKSIPFAIGLNFLAPGLGYMYMGKIIVGIAALFLILGIYASTTIDTFLTSWLGLNVIMAIDMLMLGKKKQKELANKTMIKCPKCAELIQKEAQICKHCKSDISSFAKE